MRFALLVAAIVSISSAQETVGLFFDFEQTPTELLMNSLRQEVAGIMRPAGLLFEWKALSANRGNEAFAKVVVFRFRGSFGGRLEVQPAASEIPVTLTLGATEKNGSRILPFSQVNCDNVRKLLDGTIRYPQSEAALGRAIGRVMAHELYHILLQTIHHGRHGLRRACYGPRALMARSIQFQENELKQLREPGSR